jgi:hypothetical protein
MLVWLWADFGFEQPNGVANVLHDLRATVHDPQFCSAENRQTRVYHRQTIWASHFGTNLKSTQEGTPTIR